MLLCLSLITMACSEIGGSRILLCLGLLVVGSSFCNCKALSRLRALDKLKENWARSQGQDHASSLCNGRLLIGPNSVQNVQSKGTRTTKKHLNFDTNYQADMVWAEARPTGRQGAEWDNSAVEQLLKLEPKVECTMDSMKLQVQDVGSTPGSLFFVDRGSHRSPLPLSKLPLSCGYTITTTRRDFVLVAPYDACFVSLQEDNYVLALRWQELPVRMLCPLVRPSSSNPPMVTCHSEGMVVRTEWMLSVDKIKVNLNGNWEPLMDASSKCGFVIVEHPEGVVISAQYARCLKRQDGMYTLELAGEGEIKISCPVLFETKPQPTRDSPEDKEMPVKWAHYPIPPQNPQPVPGVPDVPEVPFQKPKETGKPQLPYPQLPYFLYTYPETKTFPTAQPSISPTTKKSDGLQSKQTVPPLKLTDVPQAKLPWPFFPHTWPPQPENVPEHPTQAPVTQPPNGKVENPFNPYLHYFKPPHHFPTQKPELKPVSPPAIQISESQAPVTPQGNFPNPFNRPSEGPPSSKHEQKPPVSQEPTGQVNYPFNHFWPHMWHPGPFQTLMPPIQQTPAVAPKGQEQLIPLKPGESEPVVPGKQAPDRKRPSLPEVPNSGLYHDYYSKYLPEKKPAPKPPTAQRPLQPENQSNQKPEPPTMPSAKTPVPSEQPPSHVKPPNGQWYYPPIAYYPLNPQLPQPVTQPPASTTWPLKQMTTAQLGYDDVVSQSPQTGQSYIPQMNCPLVCPPGIFNCCPQIAFHQHLHHYVPPGSAGKDAPLVFPPPLFQSVPYSQFGDVLTADPLQEPNEAATNIQSSTSLDSPPKQEKLPYLLPLDGTQTAPTRGVPREPSATEQPFYPYIIPTKHYPYVLQREMLENVPQIQTEQYNAPKPQPSGDSLGNPVVQYSPYYIQPTAQLPVDMNYPSWHDFMSIVANYQQQPLANEQTEQSKKLPAEPTPANVDSAVDHPLVSYFILQDDPEPINSSQSERTIQPKPESKSYIHGSRRGKPRNHHHRSNPPVENLQHPGRLGKLSNPLPVGHMPRPGGESINGSHFMPFPPDLSVSAADLKSEFFKSLKGMWKPISQGSNQKNQAYGRRKAFQ